MFEWIVQQDHALLLMLNGSDYLFLDGFFWSITKMATWFPLFACLLFAVYKNNSLRQAAIVIVSVALVILIADQVASGICKPLFHRFRPSHHPSLEGMVRLVRGYAGGQYGFFSSHASNTFGIAVFFSFLIRNRLVTLAMLSYAFLSSYSRMYLGVHFPGDILCGFLWGTITGYVLYRLSRRYVSNDWNNIKAIPVGFLISMAYVITRGILWI